MKSFEQPLQRASGVEQEELLETGLAVMRQAQEYLLDLKESLPSATDAFRSAHDRFQNHDDPESIDANELAATVDAVAAAASREAPVSSTTLLSRLRALPASMKASMLAVITAAEITAVSSALAGEKPADTTSGKGTSRVEEVDDEKAPYTTIEKINRELDTARIVLGEQYVGVENDREGIFLRHNIHMPESLADLGKMFAEPVSLSFKFPYKQDTWPGRFMSGDDEKPFVFSVDIPYEYAQDFKKASPEDKAAMEQEMEQNARELLERILPTVTGFSFFKEQVEEDMAAHNRTHITEVAIDGFASPEAQDSVGRHDPRNQKLSELRAENAAHVIQKLFDARGVEADEMNYRGLGELQFADREREQLLEDAYSLHIGSESDPQEKALLELIRQYNDGGITKEDARERLDEIVGSKRKVAVSIAADERTGVLVLPVPLLLGAAAFIMQRLDRRMRHRSGRMFVHFVTPEQEAQELTSAERRAYRRRGRGVRRDREVIHDDIRGRDVAKGYGGDEHARDIAEAYVEGARQGNKGAVRQRVELGFQGDLPLPQRVEGLAYVLDRYARMHTRLQHDRAFVRRDVDLVNVVRDREALQQLLMRVTGRDRLPSIGPDTRVRVEIAGIAAAPEIHGPARLAERTAVLQFNVQVGRETYTISRREIAELAEEYIARKHMRPVERTLVEVGPIAQNPPPLESRPFQL
ncbi:MAG: hypothetical protein AAB490_04920 [Patescibacteria group bacterium]